MYVYNIGIKFIINILRHIILKIVIDLSWKQTHQSNIKKIEDMHFINIFIYVLKFIILLQ
jgi:mannose/fructose/N-acetylgalactosamine-specific phosphotransferase system component IIC